MNSIPEEKGGLPGYLLLLLLAYTRLPRVALPIVRSELPCSSKTSVCYQREVDTCYTAESTLRRVPPPVELGRAFHTRRMCPMKKLTSRRLGSSPIRTHGSTHRPLTRLLRSMVAASIRCRRHRLFYHRNLFDCPVSGGQRYWFYCRDPQITSTCHHSPPWVDLASS